ncbi:MAG TPA: TlpA disulfide reductase family protein [Pyrinomonadaceae bacterium]|nr:TlpA family protein disulfide reductase [Chloracidobacterium sp.]MBK9439083.1 TlpA family protein disulfide reductase [Chloracidobacterium sp.]MBL0240512.1 TlpA family protein disulfide reductase [Chloracidobacterium sp.]MBP9934702.1 TlpA family protein disulfide reductase [Pyrinomonadaceae bacterium]HQY66805.1 TlpA disulfide reductase family protein [Pyrinomonadaceae bacterium]
MNTLRGFITITAITMAFALSTLGQTVLTKLDGTRVDVESQGGKIVVLAIGASWLPLSDKQAEYTNSLAKRYAGKNVVFYFVVTDSTNPRSKNFASNETVAKFAADRKLTMNVLRDSDGLLTTKSFKIEQVPSFVILNKNGDSTTEPFGGIDPKYDLTGPISRAIDRLL